MVLKYIKSIWQLNSTSQVKTNLMTFINTADEQLHYWRPLLREGIDTFFISLVNLMTILMLLIIFIKERTKMSLNNNQEDNVRLIDKRSIYQWINGESGLAEEILVDLINGDYSVEMLKNDVVSYFEPDDKEGE